MIEKLLSYLEKRPREVVATAITFVLALSAVSGLCFYVLTIVVESERHAAMSELIRAKERFDEQSKFLQERARQNSEQIVRVAVSLTPLLKAQTDDIRKLKEEFAAREDDAQSMKLYLKLSEVEYRLVDIEARLSAERIIGELSAPEAVYPSDTWLQSYLLRWLVRWSAIVAFASTVLLYAILKRRKKDPKTEPS